MPKVYGLHLFMLRPDVTQEAFEQFVTEELYQLPMPPGWTFHLLKGDKGDRAGKYLLMIEIESVEARDRLTAGAVHDWEGESQHMTEDQAATWNRVLDKWLEFAFNDLRQSTVFTDYIVVGR